MAEKSAKGSSQPCGRLPAGSAAIAALAWNGFGEAIETTWTAGSAKAGNALWALCRRGDIAKADFTEAIGVLKTAPVAVPVSMRQLAASAGRLAVDLDHPVYDCVYLALAVQEQYPVVTADRRFHDTVRQHPYLSDRIVHVESLRGD